MQALSPTRDDYDKRMRQVWVLQGGAKCRANEWAHRV